MKERVITVFEHDSIRLGTRYGNAELIPRDLNELELFHDRNKGKYYSLIHKGIKFNSYVGVLRVGTLTIEVLPKADKNINHNSDTQIKNYWRNILLEMIKRSGNFNIDELPDANLRLSRSTLLDIFINAYLTEVETLLHRGLLKQYRPATGNLTNLKGRLDFSKHIAKNSVHRERFFCTYQTYSHNTPINQILHCALKIIRTIYSNSSIYDRAKRILFNFPEFTPEKITADHFQKISWTRKNSAFVRAVQIAKLIILHFSPALEIGSETILAIMFDMNDLWERYVFAELKRHEREFDYTVHSQRSIPFWDHRKIRPDIVLKKSTATYILDTKWKIPDTSGPSDADLKQMFAYNEYFATRHSVLIYPKGENHTASRGTFHNQRNQTHTSLFFIRPTITRDECKEWIGRLSGELPVYWIATINSKEARRNLCIYTQIPIEFS